MSHLHGTMDQLHLLDGVASQKTVTTGLKVNLEAEEEAVLPPL